MLTRHQTTRLDFGITGLLLKNLWGWLMFYNEFLVFVIIEK